MVSKKLKWIIGIILALVPIICWTLYDSQKKQRQSLINDATASYQRGAFAETWAKIQSNINEIIQEENGCELVISTAISTQKLKDAEATARECLKRKKGLEISLEALAMILSQDGRTAEAINFLLNTKEDQQTSRTLATLSHLYLADGKIEEARIKMLQAFQIASPWTPLLERALGSRLSNDEKFLQETVNWLLSKPEKHPPVERKLLGKLWKAKLTEPANQLLDRLGPEAVPPPEASGEGIEISGSVNSPHGRPGNLSK